MISPEEFNIVLAENGLDFFCGVPDSLLSSFCSYLFDNLPSSNNIIAANEGNAVGIACGYYLATGKAGVVYLQNSGEGNAVNPLLSIADPDVYSIPLLLLIGWRGEPGTHDEPQHVKQGKVTCSMLDAIGVFYRVVGNNWKRDLEECINEMYSNSCPVALVIPKGTFEKYSYEFDKGDSVLSREEALSIILENFGKDDFVVSTTGKTSREVFELREARGECHDHDFLTVGGMGHTSSIAFGMASGTNKNVWCVDGDGSFLMHMGALPVIAQNVPPNLKYIINNNGAHESVGGQPTVGQAIDIPGILRASGFETVIEAETKEQIQSGMQILRKTSKCALVISTHQGSRDNLGRPTTTPQQNKEAIMRALGSLGTGQA